MEGGVVHSEKIRTFRKTNISNMEPENTRNIDKPAILGFQPLVFGGVIISIL